MDAGDFLTAQRCGLRRKMLPLSERRWQWGGRVFADVPCTEDAAFSTFVCNIISLRLPTNGRTTPRQDKTLSPISSYSGHEPGPNLTHSFLLRAAELLHQYGTPSYRLERVLAQTASRIGVEGTFLYMTTALVVSIREGNHEATYLRRVESGGIDIDKLLRFDTILEDIEAKRITVVDALQRLEAAANAPAPYRLPTELAAGAGAAAGVAVIFGGGKVEVIVASLLGLAIGWLIDATTQGGWERGWLEPVAGFVAALLSFAAAQFLPLDHRLVTLAALILLLPGLALTTALTELAVGYWTAGSARLAGAGVTLLTLVLGVALAWRIGVEWLDYESPGMDPLPRWTAWFAIVLSPIAFAIIFKAPPSQWPIIVGVSLTGFLASRWGELMVGREVGGFLGALVIGCGSNAYARIFNRPAVVALTPSILVLVPGAIGYRSLTALLERHTMMGVEQGFVMVMTGAALVGGLLMANLVLPPKRLL